MVVIIQKNKFITRPLTGSFFFGKPKPPLGTVGVKAVNHCSASGFHILTLTTAKQYARVLFTFWV